MSLTGGNVRLNFSAALIQERSGKRLKFFSRLEAYGLPRGDDHFRPSAWIAPDSGFARFHVKYAEAPQFDPFSPGQSLLHGLENCLNRHLSLRFGDTRTVDNLVHNIQFDHVNLLKIKAFHPREPPSALSS